MYEDLHCPFCGSTDISDRRESFNYEAAFWAALFIHIWAFLFGFFCHKRTICRCNDCGNEFLIY